jgi:hypothetical protein
MLFVFSVSEDTRVFLGAQMLRCFPLIVVYCCVSGLSPPSPFNLIPNHPSLTQLLAGLDASSLSLLESRRNGAGR